MTTSDYRTPPVEVTKGKTTNVSFVLANTDHGTTLLESHGPVSIRGVPFRGIYVRVNPRKRLVDNYREMQRRGGYGATTEAEIEQAAEEKVARLTDACAKEGYAYATDFGRIFLTATHFFECGSARPEGTFKDASTAQVAMILALAVEAYERITTVYAAELAADLGALLQSKQRADAEAAAAAVRQAVAKMVETVTNLAAAIRENTGLTRMLATNLTRFEQAVTDLDGPLKAVTDFAPLSYEEEQAKRTGDR